MEETNHPVCTCRPAISREMTRDTPTPKRLLFRLKEEEERNTYSMIPMCQALCQMLISVYASQPSVEEKLLSPFNRRGNCSTETLRWLEASQPARSREAF